MKNVLITLVLVIGLAACGSQFTENHPGKLGEKDLICKVKVDIGDGHKTWVYDTINCVEGVLP